MSEITNPRELAARVLIVDDEAGPCESLRMILQPRYQVQVASSGSEALEILARQPIDLVTLDLNMPGIQGEELMRLLRREHPDVEVIVITGYGSVESAVEGVRYGIADYIQKPFDVVKVSSAVSRALTKQGGRRRLTRFLDQLGNVVGRGEDVDRLIEKLDFDPRLQTRVGETLRATVRDVEPEARVQVLTFLEVLADTIESQHTFMRGHAHRSAFYTGLLAERMGMPVARQEEIRLAAFLHDVGKIGVPTELLVRPGALAPDERRLVERHPEIGARLLEPLGLSTELGLAVRHHHEWWDGRGYPDALHGEQIPLAARLVSVADAYDAMTSDRPYRRAMPHERAADELRRFAGVQFDPDFVKEFLSIVESSDVDLQIIAETVSTAAPVSSV